MTWNILFSFKVQMKKKEPCYGYILRLEAVNSILCRLETGCDGGFWGSDPLY